MRIENAGLITDIFGHPVLVLEETLESGNIRVDINEDAVRIFRNNEEIGKIEDVPEEVGFWLARQENLGIIAGGGNSITHSAVVSTPLNIEKLAAHQVKDYEEDLNATFAAIMTDDFMRRLHEYDVEKQRVLMEDWLDEMRRKLAENVEAPSVLKYMEETSDEQGENESEEAYNRRMLDDFLNYVDTDMRYKKSDTYLIDKAYYEAVNRDPQDRATLTMLSHMTPADFIGAASRPLSVGTDMTGRMGTVTTLNGLPSEGFTHFLKNFADKHGTTLVAMGTATLQRAAILGAVGMVAPPLVPLAAVAYGAYKMTKAVSGIYNTLQKEAKEKQNNGMGKIASVAAAAKKHKWALLGLAAVGAAFATGIIDLPFDFDATDAPNITPDASTVIASDDLTTTVPETVVTASDTVTASDVTPEITPEVTTETVTEVEVVQEPETVTTTTDTEVEVSTDSTGPIDYAAMPEFSAIQGAMGNLMQVEDIHTGIIANLQQGDTIIPLHIYVDDAGALQIDEITSQTINTPLLQQAGVQTLGLDQNSGWTQASGRPPYMPTIPTEDYNAFLSKVDPEVTQSVPDMRPDIRTTSGPRSGG
ncbi:MAG: hypothetical protein EP349_03285 [Alphaproteobacteria bacterium]|nr:MAG: hypothetical protein EP349_03285 [Alphaproteobacteria bacterium]